MSDSPAMINRPDVSNYVVHFASKGKFKGKQNEKSLDYIESMKPLQRLISILNEKTIKASEMPWNGAKAVCFTECPWASLLAHTERYSQYGIGFSKKSIFTVGGGPVVYIRPDYYEEQKEIGFSDDMESFLTPFAPYYRPIEWVKRYPHIGKKPLDYSHEREWRVPHNFQFEYSQIEFIILGTYKDMAEFPQELKDAIGREKFILMDNYRQIEKLWPVHII